MKTNFDEDFRSITIIPRRSRRVIVTTMEKCLTP